MVDLSVLAARDAAWRGAVVRGVPGYQGELEGHRAAGDGEDAAAASGRGVAVDLAEVEDQRPAVVEDAAGAARGGVAGHLAEFQRGGAERPGAEVWPLTPCARAAQTTRIMALTALTALGLSGAPVHGRSVRSPCPATVRNIAQQCPACIRASELGGHGADGLQTVAVILGNVMTCVLLRVS